MTGAMDRRSARTRRSLHQALMTLILRKGYEDITVQDILDEADVGRSTFYAHYTGKDDLLRRGFDRLQAEMAGLRTARPGAAPPGAEPLAFSLALFEHVAGYATIYRALVGSRGGLLATQELRRILADLVKADLPGVPDDRKIAQDLRLSFVVDAFLTVLTWWLERHPGLAPGDVDRAFRALVLDGLRPAAGILTAPESR